MATTLVTSRFLLSPCCLLLSLLLLANHATAAVTSLSTDSPLQQTSDHYMSLGLQAFERGDFVQAITRWNAAIKHYTESNRLSAQGRALVHLSQAYQAIGHYKKAQASLNQAHQLAQQTQDQTQEAIIAGSLCNTYVALGPPATAESPWQSVEPCFQHAFSLATQLGHTGLAATIANNLGNWWTAQADPPQALRAYLQSVDLAQQAKLPELAAQAQANAAVAALHTGDDMQATTLLNTALAQMSEFPPTHQKATVLNKIGLTYQDLCQRQGPCQHALILRAAEAHTNAAEVAQQLDDALALSYAWGYLGRLYETRHLYAEALQLTRRALTAAQRVDAPESRYRWLWQAGRLQHAQGDLKPALEAYRRAIDTLQHIRQELSHSYGKSPTTFRQSTGRLYFEFVDLLLQQAAKSPNSDGTTPYLHEARETVELFKAAELRDYFRDQCVDVAQANPTSLDQFTHSAIIIYPIILPNRLELLVSLPQGLKRYAVAIPASRLEHVVRSFRTALQDGSIQRYMRHAQRLYTWLIQPLEADLAATTVRTLVFVPDGVLRLIPLAALYDGKAFLIEKYALATTPGLALTDSQPLNRKHLRILILGLTQAVQGFAPLPYVSDEVDTIQQLYGGTQLLNKDFLAGRIETALQTGDFSIVHIASHGQFASNPTQSFILTFDGRLTMDQLEHFIGRLSHRQEPLELLTLSACETAVGDDQAALGLAGIAIKAGARSALATLWHVADEATAVLIKAFYQQLQLPSTSRAQALRQAQLKLLADPRYQSPFFWSPFLLINNWF